MAAVTRTRTLKRSRNSGFPARLQKRARVFIPALLVEVYCYKPTSIVLKQRIDTNGLASEQMISDNIIA
jgi:hypothetical protein